MAYQWTNQPTARLTIYETGGANTFGFEGVNSANSAGTPQQFLDAANRILTIGGKTAVIDGITRSIKEQGVDDE